MEKQTLTIQVPAEVARAYEQASALDRRRAERALAFALQTSEAAASELERILDRIGTKARDRGLPEERLQQLVDGE